MSEQGYGSLTNAELISERRRAFWGQALANLFDFYDLSLILSLGAIISLVFLPKSIPPLVAFLTILIGYAVSSVARPIGAAIFGNFSDKVGRKNSIFITAMGFGILGVIFTVMPTYGQIGIAAYGLFLILRFILGIFAGGEVAGGLPLAMEWYEKRKRGYISGAIYAVQGIGTAFAGIPVLVLTIVLGEHAMVAYGWRIVYLTGAAPIFFALYVRFFVKDSGVAAEGRKKLKEIKKSAIGELFRQKEYRKRFFQAMLVSTGGFLAAFTALPYTLTILESTTSKFSHIPATALYIIGVVGGLMLIPWGWSILSQRVGRRKLGMIGGVITTLLGILGFYLLYRSSLIGNFYLAALASIFLLFLGEHNWGMIAAYLSERFPTYIRSVGSGFGYSAGLFISAWTAIYLLILLKPLRPFEGSSDWLAAGILLTLGGILWIIGFYLGPETREVNLQNA